MSGLPRADDATPPVLVVCRAGDGLVAVGELPPDVPCVVVSDDEDVRVRAAALPHVVSSRSLEAIESHYGVASEVARMIGEVNAWLVGTAPANGVPRELAYWPQHAEGGDTSQRVQDALMLVRSYEAILRDVKPARILVARVGTWHWEDDLMRACAHRAGIPVSSIGRIRLRAVAAGAWAWMRPMAKAAVHAVRSVRAAVQRATEVLPVRRVDVAIQICDDSEKHVRTVAPLLQACERHGLAAEAIGWGAPRAVERLTDEGRRAVSLESLVTLADQALVAVQAIRTWATYRAGLRRMPDRFRAGALGVDLRPVLRRSVRAFAIGELPHRYRLDRACRRYFAAGVPRAMRLWTRVLPQAVTALNALPAGRRPLFFWQPGWPYNVDEAPTAYEVPADLVFALSEAHRAQLIAQGTPAADVALAGLPWLETIRDLGARYTKRASRALIGAPADGELYVLWDPGVAIRGYTLPAEQEAVLDVVLGIATRHPGVQVLVKPHAGHRDGSLDAKLRRAGLANVTIYGKDAPTYHILNASDLLITKYSTLGIEGMALGVPAIAAMLDGERRRMVYEDAVDYAFDAGALRQLLDRLAGERSVWLAWCADMRRRAGAYTARHGIDLAGRPNDRIAQELAARLT